VISNGGSRISIACSRARARQSFALTALLPHAASAPSSLMPHAGVLDREAHRCDSAPPARHLGIHGLPHSSANRRGAEGEGFKLAMRTLDIFRTSVAGAALGFAQRALDEALKQSLTRPCLAKHSRTCN